ncbi:MAG: fibronectin type III domain-containing protein [Bdellovibrionales bacterium]|nr:fibronectin type III domain-containing protein [Bdellovibrionales bacterium]
MRPLRLVASGVLFGFFVMGHMVVVLGAEETPPSVLPEKKPTREVPTEFTPSPDTLNPEASAKNPTVGGQPVQLSSKPGEKINEEGANKVLTEVEVAWEASKGARAYELEFQPIEGSGKSQRFETGESQFKTSLAPGPYRFRIRSIDKKGDRGNWSSPVTIVAKPQEVIMQTPTDGEQIEAKKTKNLVTFRWDPFENAKGYIFRVWSERNKGEPKMFKTRSAQATLTLRAGRKYFWEVFPVSKSGVRYQRKSPPFSFVLFGKQLPQPELTILRPLDPQGVEWRQAGDAQYLCILYRRDLLGEEWKEYSRNQILEGSRWLFNLKLVPGHYRVTVQAQANMRIDSEMASKEFFVKPKLEEIQKLVAK